MAKFTIDDKEYEVDLGDSVFAPGKAETLSNPANDISCKQVWYPQGYAVFDLLNDQEYAATYAGISRCVRNVLNTDQDFKLEKYHRYVDDATHYKVVAKTRDLFPKDFDFPVSDVIAKLEKLVCFGLTNIDPETGDKLHIIVRINRPHSTDYNPPHKDIYESFDQEHRLPKIVNFWLPICGVSNKSMLPVAPGSHLIPEDKLLRTFDGGKVGGNQYRVRSIKTWDGKNAMHRPPIKHGQVLIFTPYLIHGNAINDQDDTTRVALEFRLFQSTLT